jgi:hypothetical protein
MYNFVNQTIRYFEMLFDQPLIVTRKYLHDGTKSRINSETFLFAVLYIKTYRTSYMCQVRVKFPCKRIRDLQSVMRNIFSMEQSNMPLYKNDKQS